MALKLNTRNVDGVTVIECSGRIVFGSETDQLREKIKNLIPETRQIVLNLGEVNYIDSGGIGSLVAIYTSVRNAGGNVKLANLTKRIDDLLQITKLVTVFETYGSESEAIAAFNRRASASSD